MTSLSGPSIPEGMLILVDTGIEPQPGHLVVAKLDTEEKATFKKLVQDGGKLYLKPLNTGYNPIEINGNRRIIGGARSEDEAAVTNKIQLQQTIREQLHGSSKQPDIQETVFTISYDAKGDLASHTIDARDLGMAIIGMNDLITKAADIVSNGSSEADLKVVAPAKEGSLEIVLPFSLIQ